MQKGDIVRARFLTMPEPFPGAGATKDNLYPVRKGTVVYVHPKGRYIVARQIDTPFKMDEGTYKGLMAVGVK